MEIFCVNFSLSPFSPRARAGRGKSESSLALSSFLFPEDVMRCRREGASVPYRMRRDGPRACLARAGDRWSGDSDQRQFGRAAKKAFESSDRSVALVHRARHREFSIEMYAKS